MECVQGLSLHRYMGLHEDRTTNVSTSFVSEFREGRDSEGLSSRLLNPRVTPITLSSVTSRVITGEHTAIHNRQTDGYIDREIERC